MTSHLSDDVIGRFIQATFLFTQWKSVSLQLFSRFVEVAWLIDLSDILKRPSDIIDTRRIGIDLKRNLLRRVSNRGPVSETFYEANALPLS